MLSGQPVSDKVFTSTLILLTTCNLYDYTELCPANKYKLSGLPYITVAVLFTNLNITGSTSFAKLFRPKKNSANDSEIRHFCDHAQTLPCYVYYYTENPCKAVEHVTFHCIPIIKG